jgi:hypothetical protein
MDCIQFGELLPDLDRPGTRGSELCDDALAHAEICSPCATLMMEAESLNYGLGRLAETTVGLEAPAHVEDALLGEFRRVKAAGARSKFRRDLAALAIAALVLLAVGLGFYRQHLKTAGPTPDAPNAQITTAPSVAAPADVNANKGSVDSSSEQPADNTDNEYATAFVPLPYADDPSETQGGAVVRVDLPRASLVSMGIPVAGLNEGGHVVADLMLSEDGTPQAIRLVSQSNSTQEF